jgi:hypothetical protein
MKNALRKLSTFLKVGDFSGRYTLSMNKFSYTNFLKSIPPRFMEFIQRHVCIRDSQTHSQLQFDLIEHLL